MRRPGPGLLACLPALAALVALACGGAPAPDTPSAGRTTLVSASLSDLQGLNELVAADARFTGEILEQMFLRLFEEQPDFEHHPPTFAPSLAESWSLSPDGLELTVRLRPGLVWSDGVPITAEDVRFTHAAQTSPEVAWSYAFAKDSIAAVEVVDPLTVRFRLREAYATALLDVNEGGILPAHVWGRLPFAEWRRQADWFRQNLVVSGPFILDSWTPSQEVVLRRNPRYHRSGLPRLERVVVRIVPDQANQMAQLLGGQLDFVFGVAPARTAELAGRSDIALRAYWNRQYDFICWNTRRPLFADPEVRRALTLAIDRQALVDALWHGHARVSNSPILSTVWAYDRTLVPWPHDPAEARRLLAARGWADRDGDGVLDRDGERFAFELTTNGGNRIRSDAAVMIQAQLAKVGIEARPRTLDGNTLNEITTSHRFDATLSGWGIDTSLDLRFAFHSAESEGGYNFGGYANPEVDRLIDEVRRQRDLAAAKPIFDRLQQILHREQPYTFLWEPQRISAARAELRDVQSNALATYFHLEEWWFEARGPDRR
jgi:peptide/nickel transport system substrate-binding protein